MSSDIMLTIQITAIGMGLVFGAILLLWGVMALLVRLSSGAEDQDEEVILISAGEKSEADYKRLAAIAAVAAALARKSALGEPHLFPLPPTATVSAWQSVLRTRMLNKRGMGK